MSSGVVEWIVGTEDAGARVDVLVVRRFEGQSRASARRLAEEGRIRVDGRVVPKSRVVAAGERVTLDADRVGDRAAVPDASLPLEILFEDADVVVVNKQGGAPTHPLRSGEKGTVCNALVARFPEMAGVGYGPREPGVIHRLDTGTSGALVAARNEVAFAALRDALRAGTFEKRYLALVSGHPGAPDELRSYLVKDPRDRRRVLARKEAPPDGSEPAVTHIVASRPHGLHALVELEAPVARRHQIRAHLAGAGFPLVGDTLYGGPEHPGLDRHFLHASHVAFPHPRTGGPVTVDAPLPPDLLLILAADPH